ncbi:MAG: S53 family peptidase [Sciscionella sp.]
MSTSDFAEFPAGRAPERSDVQVIEGGDRAASGAHELFTLLLRRKNPLPEKLTNGERRITRDELAEHYGADPADVLAVREHLTTQGIEVQAADLTSRLLSISAPVTTMARAFDTRVRTVRGADPWGSGTTEYREHVGEISMPRALQGLVVGVFGLDQTPRARAHIRHRLTAASGGAGFAVPELATVYGFPTGSDGSGTVLAIIELGGGYTQQDLDTYFAGVKLATPSVTAVPVAGGTNAPTGDPSGPDGEVLLDIEVAGALAPKAKQLVYFAPNTNQGFVQAVSTAVHADPTPAALSISWGQSEDSWSAQSRTALDSALADAAALGIVACVASGDGGSSDGSSDGKSHVDFPASSSHALACGGTSLVLDTNGTVSSETVWHSANGGSTGGGVSDVFPLPTYQNAAGVPPRAGGGTGRGVPDVAADADPATGYQVLIDGKQTVVGGTSAVAPLWAALACRIVQDTGGQIGPLQPKLYPGTVPGTAAQGFRDITTGSNGAYSAAPGWDACTGLGVPVGTVLAKRLGGTP